MNAKDERFRLTEEQKLKHKPAKLSIDMFCLTLGRAVNAGLEKCFEKDPTLKQHLVDTILKVEGEKQLEEIS